VNDVPLNVDAETELSPADLTAIKGGNTDSESASLIAAALAGNVMSAGLGNLGSRRCDLDRTCRSDAHMASSLRVKTTLTATMASTKTNCNYTFEIVMRHVGKRSCRLVG
jgi:hypothetical protein